MSDRPHERNLDRRTFIQAAAGAGIVSCLAWAPTYGRQTLGIPTVDSLIIHVIVDAVEDPTLAITRFWAID